MRINLTRSGNLLQIDQAKSILPTLRPVLTYKHKQFFQGPEYNKRLNRKLSGENINPAIEITHRPLYQEDNGYLYVAAGLKNKIVKTLEANGFTCNFTDLRTNTLHPADYDRLLQLPNFQFRYRQDEVLAAIESSEGGTIEAPTAFGKTHLMVYACQVYNKANIAFISTGTDLLYSTYKRLNSVFTHQVGRIGGGYYEPNHRILLISGDSVHKAPLKNANLIMADEVHELGTDRRINMLCSHYTDAKWIGFSASLDKRADGGDALIESVFGPRILTITYDEAQKNNVVAPIDVYMKPVPGDITTPVIEGRTQIKKRKAYWCHEHRNQKVAEAAHEIPQILNESDPQILIMVSTVEHLFEIKKYLPDYYAVYANMDNSTRSKLLNNGLIDSKEYMDKKKRNWILREFEAGNLKRVIATQCWKKGINAESLKAFVRADGETSSINNIQLPGRLSRIYQGKSRGLLIDFSDAFDEWAMQRSQNRLKDYKKCGFKDITPSANNGQQQKKK